MPEEGGRLPKSMADTGKRVPNNQNSYSPLRVQHGGNWKEKSAKERKTSTRERKSSSARTDKGVTVAPPVGFSFSANVPVPPKFIPIPKKSRYFSGGDSTSNTHTTAAGITNNGGSESEPVKPILNVGSAKVGQGSSEDKKVQLDFSLKDQEQKSKPDVVDALDKSLVGKSLLDRDVIAQRALQRIQSDPVSSHPVSSSLQMTKTLSDTTSERPRKRPVVRDVNHVSHQFFHVEPCIYTHRMFQRAATIFGVLKDIDTETEEQKALRRRQNLPPPPSEKIPDMEFIDAHEQIKTFELGFATLKYQKLFQEILHKTIFFMDFPDLREAYSLVCIILYDLQSRKFQRRIPLPGETPDNLCFQVEEGLLSRQTRLLSTIAKERIRCGAPSIEFLLPEQVRHKDETKSRIPVYTWVNQIKQGVEDFLEDLHEQGFTALEDGVDMSSMSESQGQVYRVDKHCPDLVVFPPHMAMYFKDSKWVKHGRLVQQDKSSCLAPHTVKNVLAADYDVIHVNVGTGMSTGHLASLLWEESTKSHLWAFGIDGSEKAKKVIRNLEVLGVKNTKVLLEDFLSTDPEDPRFRHVRVILIEANCSKSAITSPVQFIVSEGEDMQILGELSKAESDMGHVGNLMRKHERQLKHALKFTKISAVVYCTRSRYEAENESVVTKSIEFANHTSGKTGRPPYKVSPPVIPFSSEEVSSGTAGIDGRYVRFRPSDKANGCFVAIVSREPEEPKDAASSALAKKSKKKAKAEAAAAAAALEGEGGESGGASGKTTPGKKKGKKSRAKSTVSLPEVGANKKMSMTLHKAASSGAREYQNSLLAQIKKSSSRKVAPKDEEVAVAHVVKHPSPFSKTPTTTPTGELVG